MDKARLEGGEMKMTKLSTAAAYGGADWSPRATTLCQEIGDIWGACSVATEWSPLKAVLLYKPGAELEEVTDPGRAQMLAPLDASRARLSLSAPACAGARH